MHLVNNHIMITCVIRASQFFFCLITGRVNSLTYRWSFPNTPFSARSTLGCHGEQSQCGITPCPLYLQRDCKHKKTRSTAGAALHRFLTSDRFQREPNWGLRFEQNTCKNGLYFQRSRREMTKGQRFTGDTGGILLKSPVRLEKSAPSHSDSLSIWHFR